MVSLPPDVATGRAPGLADGVLPQFCMQCGTCSVVCPMLDYMDHSPRVLNALLMAGSYDHVLRSRAIWVCTGCYACTVECPKQLPVTESIYALKRASIHAGVYPRRFVTPVLWFDEEGVCRRAALGQSRGIPLRRDGAPVRQYGPAALGRRLPGQPKEYSPIRWRRGGIVPGLQQLGSIHPQRRAGVAGRPTVHRGCR